MKEFNATEQQSNRATEQHFESASALELFSDEELRVSYPAYIGLDVHKETIAVAVARAGRDAPESWGEIPNKPNVVAKLAARLHQEFDGEVLLFCYEAGPCGYTLYRQLLSLGHDCQVVVPSLIPKKPGERIKTDRLDALKLSRHLRAGNLTAVWVPDEEQEAIRDLTRARDDMKGQEARRASSSMPSYYVMAIPGPRRKSAGTRRITTGWRRSGMSSTTCRSSCRNTSMRSKRRHSV
jgi:transposase